MLDKNWFSLNIIDIEKLLETNLSEGLNIEEVSKRQKDKGLNILSKQKGKSAFLRFLEQFDNVLIYVLIIAGIVAFLLNHRTDTYVIFSVIIINAIIGFMQENKAKKTLDSIKNMLSSFAMVKREGGYEKIESKHIVPGDIILVKAGDKVPADARIIQAKQIKVQESMLTGESNAVEKDAETINENVFLADQKNMIFSSTLVTSGQAEAIVVETGDQTEIGKINNMMSTVQKIDTLLIKQIKSFSIYLSLIILGVSIVVFLYGYFIQNYTISELFLINIGLIVAAIPEGLPAILTITLAVGVQFMSKKNAIIKHLPAVETLGAVKVICSDKTGTLTKNEMTAVAVITNESSYEVSGVGYSDRGTINENQQPIVIKNHSHLNLMCSALRSTNDASVKKTKSSNLTIEGEPTAAALLALTYKAKIDFEPKKIDYFPFDSSVKYAVSLDEVNDEKIIFVTGAPDILLQKSQFDLIDNETQPINEDHWHQKIESLASKGQRVIATAYKKANIDKDNLKETDIDDGLVFIGVIGIIDPPRPEVKHAIEACHRAGVNVKMVTGDHVITAKAIAQQLGIGKNEETLTGKEIESLTDEELGQKLLTCEIFARTTPKHKLRIVKALQKIGWQCAMTGDGVNDAPALKQADIGVAMGIKGTEVSKEAADMVLTDDNFSSIVDAIKEGRRVYENIKKALLFILPTNAAQALVLIIAVLSGSEMPISPIQILWVNMVIAITLALAIAFEPIEGSIMKIPPRTNNDSILGKYFMPRLLLVALYMSLTTKYIFEWGLENDLSLSEARTLAVNTLVVCQTFYLFNCRKNFEFIIHKNFFKNKYVFIAVATLIVLQLMYIYLPFANSLFDTSAISFDLWIPSLIIGLILLIVMEVFKIITNKTNSLK